MEKPPRFLSTREGSVQVVPMGWVTDGDSHLADTGDPFPPQQAVVPSTCGGRLGVEPGQVQHRLYPGTTWDCHPGQSGGTSGDTKSNPALKVLGGGGDRGQAELWLRPCLSAQAARQERCRKAELTRAMGEGDGDQGDTDSRGRQGRLGEEGGDWAWAQFIGPALRGQLWVSAQARIGSGTVSSVHDRTHGRRGRRDRKIVTSMGNRAGKSPPSQHPSLCFWGLPAEPRVPAWSSTRS